MLATPSAATPIAAPWRLHLAACAAGGVLAALAFPGPGWWGLAWVALAPLFVALRTARNWRGACSASFAWGFAFFLGLMSWLLAMHPLTWIGGISWGLSLALVTFAWVAVAAIMGVGIAIAGWLLAWGLRQTRSAWGAVLLPAVAWCALEWLQSLGPFGFTWGSLAVTQVGALPILQLVSLTGPYALSGLVVAGNAAIAQWVLTRGGLDHPWRVTRGGPAAWAPIAAVVALVAAIAGWGTWRLAQPIAGPRMKVAAIQGNVDQTAKWQPGNQYRIIDDYLELSALAPEARLLVWPETAFPAFLAEDGFALGRIRAFEARHGQEVLTGTLQRWGAPTRGNPYGNLANSATVVKPSGEPLAFEAKVHLVPFGEYVPWRNVLGPLLGPLGLINVLGEDLTPGVAPHPFTTSIGKVDSDVCFDSIIAKVSREKVRAGAQVLAVITNDAWYKRTSAAVQHEAQARLRAVETHRFLIRAANTGISAIIDPDGRVLSESGLMVPAVVHGEVVPLSDLTPYARFGDWAGVLALAACALTAGVLCRRTWWTP